MRKYSMLVLTDHRGHSGENSIYALLRSMYQHEKCAVIEVATRSLPSNHSFFYESKNTGLMVSKVDENFTYDPSGNFLQKNNAWLFFRSTT